MYPIRTTSLRSHCYILQSILLETLLHILYIKEHKRTNRDRPEDLIMTSHMNIVNLLDVSPDEDASYFTYELMDVLL